MKKLYRGLDTLTADLDIIRARLRTLHDGYEIEIITGDGKTTYVITRPSTAAELRRDPKTVRRIVE